jgi:hypothetical protein
MILIILMIVWFAVLAALAIRIAIVRRESAGTSSWERSPHLLDSTHDLFEPAIDEAIEATPLISTSSEPATAEHMRDGAQEDLYVGP